MDSPHVAQYDSYDIASELWANQGNQNECITDGYFDGCAPGNLVCLCNLDQDNVSRYVRTVQPCLDGEAGRKSCTAGAVASKSPFTPARMNNALAI